METLLELENPGCPLGIHVMPYFDGPGRWVPHFSLWVLRQL